MVALSATCTKKTARRVKKCLNLSDKTVEIIVSPDKPNIKLSVSKVSTDVETSMFWIIDPLQELLEKFPRVLVYCTSINDASKIYNYIVREVPSSVQHIDMYHSETEDLKKEFIVNELKNCDSSLRIVVSTSALGMGIDAKAFHSVILFGAQTNCSDFIQEIGRVGRDNMPSVALILYNRYHQRLADEAIKKILMTKQCRRVSLLENFLEDKDLQEIKDVSVGRHTCCDNCAAKCSCNKCELLPVEKMFNLAYVNSKQESDTDSDSDKTEMYESLDEDLGEIL